MGRFSSLSGGVGAILAHKQIARSGCIAVQSGCIGGVESDCSESIAEVASEQLDELKDILTALGCDLTDYDKLREEALKA